MGYAVYEDRAAADRGVERWAGYGIPAECDMPDCRSKIDRGLGYRRETYIEYDEPEDGPDVEREVDGCELSFCEDHRDHRHHGDEVVPKPDTPEWVRHQLTDASWHPWRIENPAALDRLLARRWRDRQGDVWRFMLSGLMVTPETARFSLEHVEKKWGPLVPLPAEAVPTAGQVWRRRSDRRLCEVLGNDGTRVEYRADRRYRKLVRDFVRAFDYAGRTPSDSAEAGA